MIINLLEVLIGLLIFGAFFNILIPNFFNHLASITNNKQKASIRKWLGWFTLIGLSVVIGTWYFLNY